MSAIAAYGQEVFEVQATLRLGDLISFAFSHFSQDATAAARL